MEEYEMSDVLD